ncbi:uncharacterized protein FOMMEDRAFT_168112 [Fomitiporia mediterranea MF3/22]|uniref:uncharacterized protein n=1 Tax=Fomitiporia mediterranea (strain MF3/22) TaxID=694068 RepID=UPI0004407875|nr:uncharacterized protein FOMMEDRAFT_168112 [Fomitiporia mediterranea MF3/22]EJD03028.1 hypothetical protein FOMMEDRAFT_168112 [Fomitiporia mediterranea MF3/22]
MNDQDKPPIKRKRVTKACLVCAKSRRKCDGQQPLCGTCKGQNLQCTWSDVPSRRGPPKGYRRGSADPSSLGPKILKIREHIQALQLAYGERIVLDELHKAIFGDGPCDVRIEAESASASAPPESRSSTIVTSSTRRPIGSSASDTSGHATAKNRSDWSQDEHEGDLRRCFLPSLFLPSICPLLDHAHSDMDEGSSSGMAFLATSMRYMHTGGGPLTPVSDNERISMEKYSPWALRDHVERHPLVRRKSTATTYIPQPSPEDIEILLKTYWASIHPHWPILYKPAFDAVSIFKIYEEVPLALLYAMYALSARLTPTPALGVPIAETFRKVAEDELQSDGAFRSDINTCTALFLLSLYNHGEGNQRQAWVHCGVAAMMALDLGLHKSAQGLPLVEHERRVRVFWNIYVYEKVLSCEMGRPALIRMIHCDPVRLSEEQSDEYETVVHPGTSRFGLTVRLYTISIFNAAVDLFRIFERVLSEVHSAASPPARATRERLVAELDRELEEWQKSLGPRCKYPKSDDQTPTRSLYLCHGWYHTAIILVHRPLIPRPRVGQTFASNYHHKKATEHANRLVDLLALFAAGQEIDKLPPNDAYLIFTAATLHVFNLTLNDKQLREAARPRLEQCVEWLRGLAETWSFSSQYKLLLDAFSQAASNTLNHSQSMSPTSSTPVQSHQTTHPQPQNVHNVAYPAPSSGVPYPLPQNAEGSMSQQQQMQQHQQVQPPMYAAESEQKFTTPELFSLENYYWNDFQTGVNPTQQMQQYYAQSQNSEVPTHAQGTAGQVSGVYYDVLRLLQEEGRTS